LSAPVRVAEGEVEVELRLPGFVRQTKTMRLEPGQYQRVFLRAHKEEPAPPPPAAPPPAPLPVAVPTPAAPAPAPTAVVVTNVDDKRRDATPPATTGRLALKWVAWGLGAAAVGVGVYGALANEQRVADFDKMCSLNHGVAVQKDGSGVYDHTCDGKK